MGRPKKPVTAKQLSNTYRPDRNKRKATTLDKVPEPSDRLNDDASIFYYQYAHHLLSENRLTFEAVKLCEDLSWWECQRDKLEGEVQEAGTYHVYHNKDGSVKHSQPTAAFSNLTAANNQIDRLRRRLGFQVPEADGKKSEKPQGLEALKYKNF